MSGGQVLGIMGEIHPLVAQNFDIKPRVCACELDIAKIVDIYNDKLKKKSPDVNKKKTKKLPCSSKKDLTILIPTYNRAKYLKRVLNFFDDYEDKNFDIVIVDSSNKEFKEENQISI